MSNSHRRMTAPSSGASGSIKAPLFRPMTLSQTGTIGYNTTRRQLLSRHSCDIACPLRALGAGGAAAWSTGGHG
jgi:hypothetical protein